MSTQVFADARETGDPASDPPAIAADDSASTEAIAPAEQPGNDTRNAPVDKRVFGVLPNYRTANASDPFKPLTTAQKFHIGLKDSTDYPVLPLAGAFAALAQLTDQHPSYGQGMKGYAKRFGSSLSDQVVGNMLTESIMPSLFHEDPRYFRRGYGTAMSRFGYAATRIFVNPNDKGQMRFNFGEVLGNAGAAAFGNIYYPGERGAHDNIQRFYTALATDSISQVLKEFWPDIKRKYFQRHKNSDQ